MNLKIWIKVDFFSMNLKKYNDMIKYFCSEEQNY